MSPQQLDWGSVKEDTVEIVEKKLSPKEKHASIQRRIAMFTARAYFILLATPLVLIAFKTITVNDAIELIKTIAAVLGGIVGMVWVFYFHKGD